MQSFGKGRSLKYTGKNNEYDNSDTNTRRNHDFKYSEGKTITIKI